MKGLHRLLTTLDDKILRHLHGRLAMSLRVHFMRSQGAKLGRNVFLGTGVRVLHPAGLIIEDDVVVTRDVVLDARGNLILRRHALIGFETILLTHTHRSDKVGIPIQKQGMYNATVEIGERTWIGTRAVILPGAKTPPDTIVGSGAVVTGALTESGVYGGVPARMIKERS